MNMRQLIIRKANYLGLVALALTSACASGGGSDVPDPLNFATTQEAVDSVQNLIFDVGTSGFVPTTAAQLPTSGSVDYQGYLGIAGTDDTLPPAEDFLTAVGRVELSANFAGAGAITGTADHFIDGNDEQMTGGFTIAATSIGASGGFTAQLDGTITNASDFGYTYQVPMTGKFVGPNVDYLLAFGEGDFTDDVTNVVTPFQMALVAQR